MGKVSNDGKTEMIQRLAACGFTAWQIGQSLNLTKNAVIGRAWRHGIILCARKGGYPFDPKWRDHQADLTSLL
jgi:hypothetical protein